MTGEPKHVIVGGGMVGSCVAYFLAREGIGRQVVVLEPDPSYAASSTRWSAAAIRTQFNLGINVAMSRFGFEFFAGAADELPVEGDAVDIGFERCPYLVLSGPDGIYRTREAYRRQCANGADVAYLEPSDLEDDFPWLNTDGVGSATLGRDFEGWIDPLSALRALRRKSESLGVTFVAEPAVSLDVRAGRVQAAVLGGGSRIPTDTVVNAAGVRARVIAEMAGHALPIEARVRTAFVFRCPRPIKGFLNVVDPTVAGRGVYVRPYGAEYLAVTSPAPSADTERFDRKPDVGLFDEIIRPALSRRVRGFDDITLSRVWAGHYDMNTFDQNAVIGWVGAPHNMLVAGGFSGHGVMHAPAAGRGIAELILTGGYQTLDLAPFDVRRIAAGARLDDVQPSEHRRQSAGV